ncbi:FAD-binding protein [Gordonia sp. LSe1-13]|uniref:FAD-binding protein n=1 Tax=Gordonia sesuvii TaxID=3116777 RepID=A0ABU7M983_9ACTN|nr:FAD-binding protein [Gordonia sp. LSe1-13]
MVGLGTCSGGNDNGTGIQMAQAVGAAVRHMSAGQVGIAAVPGLMVRGMVVNSHGQRFINEDVYPGLLGQAALFKHDLKVWVIVDEQAFEEVPEVERWGTQPTHMAETLTELEMLTGMPPGSLESTVTQYNSHAENGEDPYFHKSPTWLRPLQPPFAAIDVQKGFVPPEGGDPGSSAAVFSLGGLEVDIDGRVIDHDGRPIPGLFAAGRSTSGLHSWGYVSGTSLGDGTFFGRRAGRVAATTSDR